MEMLVASGTLDNFMQLLASIFIFIFVLFITYWVTKWIGNYQKTQFQNRNMQIIETMRIANSKYIQIIRIADVYLVVAVCKDTIVTLTRLEAEDIEKLQLSDDMKAESFQNILQKIKALKK